MRLPSGVVSIGALLWVLLLSSVELLRILVSFEGLDDTLSAASIGPLLLATLEHGKNLPAIELLARGRDHGLREALAVSCSEWTLDMLRNVLDYCRGNHLAQLLFLPSYCRQHLHRRRHLVDQVEEAAWQGILMHPTLCQTPAAELKRYEEGEPRGLWWPEYGPNLGWKSIVAHRSKFVDGPIFRVGMLDLFDAMQSPQQLRRLQILYLKASSVVEENVLKVTATIYGMMRACAKSPSGPGNAVVLYLRCFAQKKRDVPSFGPLLRVVDLWLAVFAVPPEECGNDPSQQLTALIGGPTALHFATLPLALMSALLVIVFGSARFKFHDRHVLIDCFTAVLPQLDDFDLSNFLWHAALFPHCNEDAFCIQGLLRDVAVRSRLLRIAPFRTGSWISLLLPTSYAIQYFRRWQMRYIDPAALEHLLKARTSGGLLEAISAVPWGNCIPRASLAGWPLIKELRMLLATGLNDHAGHFVKHDFGEPHRIWICLRRPSTDDTNDLPRSVRMLLQLLLRLRLHYGEDSPGDLSGSPKPEITYELCSETIARLRLSLWTEPPPIAPLLDIIYPPWWGEELRSRMCYC